MGQSKIAWVTNRTNRDSDYLCCEKRALSLFSKISCYRQAVLKEGGDSERLTWLLSVLSVEANAKRGKPLVSPYGFCCRLCVAKFGGDAGVRSSARRARSGPANFLPPRGLFLP